MPNRVCELLGIDLPLLAFSHCRDVVVEVSKAGGFGVLGASAHSPEGLEQELAWIDRNIGGRPYGVDILIPGKLAVDSPDLTRADVIKLIKQTARQPDGTRRWTPELGWGILDAGAAVAAARTIDVQPPISRLRAPKRSSHRRILLRWTGEDPAPAGLVASGIARFEVYEAAAGHRAHRIATTRRRSLRFRGRPGRRYSFYTIAIDWAGNRGAPPTRADARTRISVRAR